MADTSTILATPVRSSAFSAAKFDTRAGSGLHILAGVLDRLEFSSLIPITIYTGAVFLTFLPLIVAGCFGHLSMMVPSPPTLKMPFFYDASTIFMFVVSFPCLLILTMTDDKLLNFSLSRVQSDGIVTISEADEVALATRWWRLFLITNLGAQTIGLVVGCIVAYFIFKTSTITIGSWPAVDKHMLPIGYVFLYCNFLFSVVITIYVVRSCAIALLLRDIVSHAELRTLPLHPDKAGGLEPIGRLGLRNQYALTVLGLNIVLGAIVTHFFLKQDNELIGFIGTAAIAYLIVGPLVFMAPLLPFRDGMIKNKAQLMSGVALRMRTELDDLRSRLQSGAVTADDDQMLERLRKIGAVIEELPVWPFDAVILRKFFTAYVVPILSSLGVPIMKVLVRYFQVPNPFQ